MHIDLGMEMVATQLVEETDSFGSDYDATAIWDENTSSLVVPMYVSAANDAELAAALDTIQNNSEFWNKRVYVLLADTTYSANHEFNQYPNPNGNNYSGGVVKGDPATYVTFIGAENGETKITGNFVVKGFGYAGTGFGTATAYTDFENITFDTDESVEENGEDKIALYVLDAANDIVFRNCTFVNATHIKLGEAGAKAVGKVTFEGCTFDNGGCLSDYYETLNIINCEVLRADNGFLNKSKAGTINVVNSTINAGKYFLRTRSSGLAVNVEDCTITLYESEGRADLVFFRVTNESATFTNCTLPNTYTTQGVDADSILTIK